MGGDICRSALNPLNMDDGPTQKVPAAANHRDIEPLQHISEIRNELEWYLRGCVPWKDLPRVERATDAIVGITPLDTAIEQLRTSLDATDCSQLPDGYGEVFSRTIRLLVSLTKHERWVRLYESERPPSADLLRITSYPMTESTTIVLSAKYLFGEMIPTVVFDVSTPRNVDKEVNQKSQAFERVQFHPSKEDGSLSFSPRFGPATHDGTYAAEFFGPETLFGNSQGPPATDAEGDIPPAVAEIGITTLPQLRPDVEGYLSPRGLEADPAMMMRRIETAQQMTDPIYPVAPGMYRIGYRTAEDEPQDTEQSEAVPPNSDVPALGPGADAPQDATEYVVNIDPDQATEADGGMIDEEDPFGHNSESASCLCDDFIYRGAPSKFDCKHILTVKRLIGVGLLPPPTADPESWLVDQLDECEQIIREYAQDGRVTEMRLDEEGITVGQNETMSTDKRVTQIREMLLTEVEEARDDLRTVDLRTLVGRISRFIGVPAEAWPTINIGWAT